MQNHRRLHAYALALDVAAGVYRLTRTLPADERYVLSQQMRRAALSIGSNIAEGCGRSSPRDFASFLDIALGSACELEFQLDLCGRIPFGDPSLISYSLEQVSRLQRMLSRLIIRVRSTAPR